MRTILKYVKQAALVLLLAGMQKMQAQCTPPVPSFLVNQLGNGNVQFVSTSTGTTAGSQYYWYNSSNLFDTGDPGYGSFLNGTYTIELQVVNSYTPLCLANTSLVITVTSNTCNLVASYTATQSSALTMSFNSTSTGTTAGSTYTWDYGDNSSGTGNPATHTYSAPNYYNITLTVDNGGGCIDSTAWSVVTVTAPCGLTANFVANQLGSGNVQFVSTSTGTTASSAYGWSVNSTYMAVGDPWTHNFLNGTYTVELEVMNSYTPTLCNGTTSQVVTVTSNTCNLAASFNSTVGASGLVNFASTSTGTTASMSYTWNFGDGNWFVGGPTTSHTYSNAGLYNVYLQIADPSNAFCSDSAANQVNVNTVPCVANSNFTLTQISPGYWNATPAYPWNVVSATWDWGDATQSNALFTSHTYCVSGMYTICLSVSVSCGATSTTCASYSITRTSQPMTMVYINVTAPSQQTVVTTNLQQQTLITEYNTFVFPNPSSGEFNVNVVGINENEARIKIYNITGDLVYDDKGNITNGNLEHHIKLKQAQGIYFLKIESGTGIITKKIILKE